MPVVPETSSVDSVKEFVKSFTTNAMGEVVPNPALDYGEAIAKAVVVSEIINTRNEQLEELNKSPDEQDQDKINNLGNELSDKGKIAEEVFDIDLNPYSKFIEWLFSWLCLVAGTLIATPDGERPIESLQPGDLISTAEGPQPVRFICRTSHLPPLLNASDGLPIRIAAGALGERGPVRDLYVSPDHAILIDGHLLHASVLVNGTTITHTSLAHWQQRHNQPIEYLNIELEWHQLITAEGLVVESFVDNRPRSDWDNYTAYLSLYHQELPIRELLLPRVKFKRQLSSALRRLLQQLADGGVQHRQLEAAG
jgi:hypothetical protein